MSRSVNKVLLIGHVGQDPEIRTTRSGSAVANMSVATNWQIKDRDGRKEERVDWHRVTAFGAIAQTIEQSVNKGDRICIEGRIQYSQAQVEGATRYYTNIIATGVILLSDSAQPPTRGSYQEPRGYDEPPF